jgi:mono/diheme cytochrome c family protein
MTGSRLSLIIIAAALAAALPARLSFAGDAAATATPNPLQIARGAREWAETCGQCHNLRDPKEFSDKSWEVIVTQMGVRAGIPGQAERDIKAFLKASND